MSNISKKSLCFEQVVGIQDVSHENAAACSGGSLTLFDDIYTTPIFTTSTGSLTTLPTNAQDRASSVSTTGGEFWNLYNFAGGLGSPLSVRGNVILNSAYNDKVRSVKRA